MPYDECEQRQQAVNKARESLVGMFEGLVIMGCFVNEHGMTVTCRACDGNYHAQTGMMTTDLQRRQAGNAIDVAEHRKGRDDD